MAVRAMGIRVVHVIAAYNGAVMNGTRGALLPTIVRDYNEGLCGGKTCRLSTCQIMEVSSHIDDDDYDDD